MIDQKETFINNPQNIITRITIVVSTNQHEYRYMKKCILLHGLMISQIDTFTNNQENIQE